ncbi:hypothetical protein GCM10009731_35270 [Streptomyces globosus]
MPGGLRVPPRHRGPEESRGLSPSSAYGIPAPPPANGPRSACRHAPRTAAPAPDLRSPAAPAPAQPRRPCRPAAPAGRVQGPCPGIGTTMEEGRISRPVPSRLC